MALITVDHAGVQLHFNSDNLHFILCRAGNTWAWVDEYRPMVRTVQGDIVYFDQAQQVTHRRWKSGVGEGILSHYEGFAPEGKIISFAFETLVWTEGATGNVYFEFIPIREEGIAVQDICWPGPMAFDAPQDDWYSVLNILQGLLLPNNWPTEVTKLSFDGQLCSNTAYMPWFGQVRPQAGYMAICQHPWDAAFQVDHPTAGPYTHVGIRWLPSLGRMTYRRVVRYTLFDSCDYNDLCKAYRQYAKETGLFTSLAEKAARNPLVHDLIGAAFVHKGIKAHVKPDTCFYNAEQPEKNEALVSFSARAEEIRRYKARGVEKLYLHLDGWGDAGYDNRHPDYLPACQEAGGWEGMKLLSDTIQQCGYLFGLHDQYRDYYFDAPTFDREFACQAPDGSILDVSRWAGGRQSYLCATQAPFYVKRNFEEVLRHGIHLDASYLDVFTCNEGDECANPRHRMTRQECFAYRSACFSYLWSKGILPSSEEVTDWAMQTLVFAHYGPYDFMLQAPGTSRKGIPVPLFNLVYHDCLILPWPMDRLPGQEDYMLYALLNGGGAYLEKDAAYPGCDGAFAEPSGEEQLDENIRRWRIVAGLQQRVAMCEMLRHEFVDGCTHRQRTTFSDGTVVTVDLQQGSYTIETAPEARR